jgi:hypothetical protein
MTEMTSHQAYLAMYSFLEAYYRRGHSDEVAALLASMSLLSDGKPADAAIAKDWADAVRRAVTGDVDPLLKFSE